MASRPDRTALSPAELDNDGVTVSVVTARDSAILMGFPLTWTLPKGSRAAQRAVGNAM